MDPHDKAVIHSSDESNWRTPPGLFAALDEEVCGFGLDLAADGQNVLTGGGRYLGPGGVHEDALTAEWTTLINEPHDGFLNPPYSRKRYRETHDPAMLVENWAKKAYEESIKGFTTYGLFPFAPQTGWFRQYVYGHADLAHPDGRVPGHGWSGHAAMEVRRFPYRLSFLRPDGAPAANAGVNSCVIIWKKNPGYVGPWVPVERYWSYK